jgi:hypothetical protein
MPNLPAIQLHQINQLYSYAKFTLLCSYANITLLLSYTKLTLGTATPNVP